MSQELINHREDLKRLVEEGYEIEVRSGHLILHRVPYVTSERAVKYGQLICSFDGSKSGPPPDHTMYFAGEYPCDDQGAPIEALRNSSERQELAKGLWVDHYFSARPMGGTYEDYRHKITHYAHVIGRCARRIDPGAVARSGKLVLSADPNDPFVFMETASSRAGITRLNERLSGDSIGIVGLGGTGSYILDYVSKTRVAEIHLFDGDRFKQHNAFRAPGPTTTEELDARPTKVQLYSQRYARMRNGIVAHEFDVEIENVDVLRDLDFVFVAVDDNETRRWLLPTLSEMGVPFVDVGMGIEKTDDSLLGVLRTSFCETPRSSTVRQGEGAFRDIGEYERNVQIVELNALNAALAVIRWKKLRGFYVDLGQEDRSTYTIDGNHMSNRVLERADDSE
ncbi:MAG: ThiF family adenylyltransferase [Boseongicola sp.]|nr:ThiF family adenylyltransferase [Boseongicola sp.]